MNSSRHVRVPVDGREADIDRKALWVVSERALPTIVRPCVSCRSTRHRPTGKIRVNANHKLLDVWLLICCVLCGRTSKIPVHERVAVRPLDNERLLMFENNDPAVVRQLAMDATLARRAAYRLDWTGTWRLDTDLPFYDLQRTDAAPLEVIVRFEVPVPVRVGKLLTAGFGLSRSALRGMVDSGRIRLPLPVTARAREDFRFLVVAPPLPAERA
ncbi:DUF1062 domain-containing protein [Micromonospora sp. S-DT3-3-22]|uniref:DUF1062 domain-containing protein n=1 Tax=Micromonospora sp. S-DT3-3-22 TaxID=2755359 RepID=UPI00188F9989|nr:DUF1062 domain-containing protein [Micromonospora sp. S-DT3-3-22]